MKKLSQKLEYLEVAFLVKNHRYNFQSRGYVVSPWGDEN